MNLFLFKTQINETHRSQGIQRNKLTINNQGSINVATKVF